MTIQPDIEASLSFLEHWRPGGPWALTAIPVDKKKIRGGSFKIIDDCRSFLVKYVSDHNCYFHVNLVDEKFKVKADRENVTAVEWLHVDIDARVGEPLDRELERIRLLLTEKLPSGVPKPTVIVFSGGGYQAFWRLKEPILISGNVKKADEIGLYNLQLEILLGGDHCHDCSRIMRLPGTINFPDKRKREKGRIPVLAEVLS